MFWLWCLLAVLVLWLNGRYWRKLWLRIRPSQHIHLATGGDGKTLTILWTGAFNDATIHYERLVPLYQQIGDVCVIRFADLRHDAHDAMLVGYEFAREHGYELVVLGGASHGDQLAYRYVEHTRSTLGYKPSMKLIGADGPLNGTHLPLPQWLLKIAPYLHAGPLFNLLLSRLVTWALFKQLKPNEMDGVDMSHLNRHMAAMWGCQLSVILEQGAAIASQPAFENVGGIPKVILKCRKDEVIRGDLALKDQKTLIGRSLIEVFKVASGHVQYVEKHNAWYAAHKLALQAHGFTGLR